MRSSVFVQVCHMSGPSFLEGAVPWAAKAPSRSWERVCAGRVRWGLNLFDILFFVAMPSLPFVGQAYTRKSNQGHGISRSPFMANILELRAQTLQQTLRSATAAD